MTKTDLQLHKIFEGETFQLNGEELTRELVLSDVYYWIEELKKYFKEND